MRVKDILQSQNIEFREKGKDFIIHCLNPEHDDSSPSMRVDALTGVYHCFSCGHKGSLLKDVGHPDDLLSKQAVSVRNKIKALLSPYLEIPKTALTYKLPWRGISVDTLQEFEAFSDSTLMPDRIVFPIKDFSGNITAFIGRYTHSEASNKYYIHPSEADIYLFPATPKKVINNTIVLVEGLYDVLNLYQNGVKNSLACLGVVTLLKKWRRNLIPLKTMGVERVLICFDGDKAGRDNAEKLADLISSEFDVEIINLPEGKDPGNLSRKEIEKYVVNKVIPT